MEIKSNHLYLIRYETKLKNVRTGEYYNIKELLTGYFNLGAEGEEKYFEGMAYGKTIKGFAYNEETYATKDEYDKRFAILKDLGELL